MFSPNSQAEQLEVEAYFAGTKTMSTYWLGVEKVGNRCAAGPAPCSVVQRRVQLMQACEAPTPSIRYPGHAPACGHGSSRSYDLGQTLAHADLLYCCTGTS